MVVEVSIGKVVATAGTVVATVVVVIVVVVVVVVGVVAMMWRSYNSRASRWCSLARA